MLFAEEDSVEKKNRLPEGLIVVVVGSTRDNECRNRSLAAATTLLRSLLLLLLLCNWLRNSEEQEEIGDPTTLRSAHRHDLSSSSSNAASVECGRLVPQGYCCEPYSSSIHRCSSNVSLLVCMYLSVSLSTCFLEGRTPASSANDRLFQAHRSSSCLRMNGHGGGGINSTLKVSRSQKEGRARRHTKWARGRAGPEGRNIKKWYQLGRRRFAALR